MRTKMLAFLDVLEAKTEPEELKDFWRLDEHDVPSEPGVYILVADEWFTYPGGKSPVFYIGQGSVLRNRLLTHLRYARQIRNGERTASASLYWPRYEYAGVFGKTYTTLRTWQRMTPKNLEDEVMAGFATRYRAFPVANGAGAWNRLHKYAA